MPIKTTLCIALLITLTTCAKSQAIEPIMVLLLLSNQAPQCRFDGPEASYDDWACRFSK